MKIEGLVKDCMMDVEFYVNYLYDWDRHYNEEKQNKDDINKVGSSLKIFGDEFGNVVHVLKSKSISELPEELLNTYTDSSCEMMKELLKKEFFFCMVVKNDNPQPIFPNEIWLTFDAAVECCIKYL